MAAPMTFAATDEQRQLRAMLRDLFDDRATSERVRAVMRDGGADDALWQELASLGLLGLPVAEDQDGGGASFAELALLVEESGRRLAPIPLLSSAVLGTMTFLAAANETHLESHLPDVVAGRTRLALAHLGSAGRPGGEPGITARQDDGTWLLDGRTGYVVDGASADLLIVAATTPSGLGLFLVPGDAPGLQWEPIPPLDLTRPLAHADFDDLRVEASARLSDGRRDAAGALQEGLTAGAVALACEQVGAANRILEVTISHAKDRVQFGRPIGSFQAIKHRLADHLVRLESARSAAWYAALVVASGDEEELAIVAPMAKALCSETFEAIAADCLQIHGGIGFTWEHDVHLYLKRAKSSKALLGSPVHHRRLLADALGF